jgi:type II secretory pathway component PulF
LSLTQKIAEGQPLAEGMRDWFAINVVEIIRVGESGGALAQTMKSAINTLAQSGLAYGAFIGAITYPLFVIIAACFLMVFINNKVFVQFKAIKPIAEWPSTGQQFVAIAEFVQYWWWILILAIIAIVILLRIIMVNYIGEYRTRLDKIPPFTFFRALTAARTLETLGLLVVNGVVFKSAIKVMQGQAKPYLLSHLEKMEQQLSMGKTNIADVLDTGLIDSSDLMRLRVMAEVKGFEHGLVRMGVRGAEQTTATLKTVSKIVGGVMLLVGFGLILIMVSGIMMTGMSLSQT